MSHIDCSGRLLVVTGVGYQVSSASQTAGANVFTNSGMRPNIGAGVAIEAARQGYSVLIVSRTEQKLRNVCKSVKEIVPGAEISHYVADLSDPAATAALAASVVGSRELDLVHSAGLSAETYSIGGGNPFLSLEETAVEHPSLEFRSVVTTLHLVVKAFLPRWRAQGRTRVVVVSSMSGIRAVPFGFSHASAKAALHQALRSLTLELNPIGIRFSEVAPGMVNTGMYDPPSVDAAARAISLAFGYRYEAGKLPQMHVSAVADAALLCLTSDAHVLSINLVADGQFPNLGA